MSAGAYQSGSRAAWRELLLPWAAARSLGRHRTLLWEFVKRDVLARYRGSFLGVLWSLLRPLAMLALYTVVFGVVMQPQLGGAADQNRIEFVLSLFCGLLLFDFLAETLYRAPGLVVSRPSYVKRVVFPLEVLPVAAVGAALLQMAVGFVPFLIALAAVRGAVSPTLLWLPLVILPLVLLALGLSWLLSSLTVFVRDVGAVVPVAVTVLLFASAVFYGLDQVPADVQPLFLLNPLAVLIQEARQVVLAGLSPNWIRLGAALVLGLVVAVLGYAFFMRTKRAFADVM